MNNVILHFPDLEPNQEDLVNIHQYWTNLTERLHNKLLSDLANPESDYQVKLIDFGLSKTLEED